MRLTLQVKKSGSTFRLRLEPDLFRNLGLKKGDRINVRIFQQYRKGELVNDFGKEGLPFNTNITKAGGSHYLRITKDIKSIVHLNEGDGLIIEMPDLKTQED